MLRSDLCDYTNAYIVVKGIIAVGANNQSNKAPAFKNNVSFRSCTSKINNTFINNAEDLDIVMPIYNLLECSDNYSMTPRSLWSYYRDEMKDDTNENSSDDYR